MDYNNTNTAANHVENPSMSDDISLVKSYCGKGVPLSKANCTSLAPTVRVARTLMERGYRCTQILGASIYVESKLNPGKTAAVITGATLKNWDHNELLADGGLVELLAKKGVRFITEDRAR